MAVIPPKKFGMITWAEPESRAQASHSSHALHTSVSCVKHIPKFRVGLATFHLSVSLTNHPKNFGWGGDKPLPQTSPPVAKAHPLLKPYHVNADNAAIIVISSIVLTANRMLPNSANVRSETSPYTLCNIGSGLGASPCRFASVLSASTFHLSITPHETPKNFGWGGGKLVR